MKTKGIIMALLLFASFVYADEASDLNSYVIAYFPFDNNESDSTGNISNSISGATSGATGIINETYDFDGSNDYAQLGSITGIKSFQFWMNPDTAITTASYQYFGQHDSGGASSGIMLGGGSGLVTDEMFSFFDNDLTVGVFYWKYTDIGTTSFDAGEWLHFVMTWDSVNSNYRLYINGSDKGLANEHNSPLEVTGWTTPYIARRDSSYFNGRLDEIAFFDSSLTSDHVDFLYNLGSPETDQQFQFQGASAPATPVTTTTPGILFGSTTLNTNLLSYYTFNNDNVINDTLYDIKSNHDGTIYNTVKNITGIEGEAFNFSSVGGRVVFADDDSLTFTTGFTVCGWVKRSFTYSVATLFSKFPANPEYVAYCPGNYCEIALYDSPDIIYAASSNNITDPGEWGHICLVDSNTGYTGLQIYSNGTIATDSQTDDPGYINMPNTATNARLGYYRDTDASYSVLDNIGVWNRPLTSDEISFLFELEKEGKTVSDGYIYLHFYDEDTLTYLNTTNITLEVTSDVAATEYTVTNGSIIITPNQSQFITLEYEADGYDTRRYYINFDEGDMFNVNLFLLAENLSTMIFHKVYNQNGGVLENVYIKLQKYYTQINAYTTVSMAKTNYEGEALLYAEMYTEYYKLVYTDSEGTILGSTSPSAFFNTETEDTISTDENPFMSWRLYDNVYHNVTFINDSGDVYARFIYSSNSNVVRTGCLKVQRITALDGIETICNNCTDSASATLTCDINESLKGQYKAIGMLDTNTTGSWYNIDVDWLGIVSRFEFGSNGVFIAFLLVGTITFIGISSIIGSIVLMIVGMIAISIFGLVVGLNYGFIILFASIGLIVLFLARRSTE